MGVGLQRFGRFEFEKSGILAFTIDYDPSWRWDGIGFRRFDVIIKENDKIYGGAYVFIYRLGSYDYSGGLLHWLSYGNPIYQLEHGEGFRNFNNKSLDNCDREYNIDVLFNFIDTE